MCSGIPFYWSCLCPLGLHAGACVSVLTNKTHKNCHKKSVLTRKTHKNSLARQCFLFFIRGVAFLFFFFHTKYFFHSLRKTAFFKFLKNAFKLLCFYLVAVIFTRASALLVGKEAGTHIEAYSRFQNSTKSFFIDDGRFWTWFVLSEGLFRMEENPLISFSRVC